MSQKRIPTPTQDAGNWGIILNDHLSQTKNPVNGAFNSFDQFAQRPTNLTADDAGKTYLYTQTGNWHEWSGTEWKVQNKSEINVKDYGAIGDGVADDTVAVQNLIYGLSPLDSTLHAGHALFFPEGIYLLNITTSENTSNIRGAGNSATFLKSFTPNGYAVVIGINDAWKKLQIEHVSFIGDSLLTRGGIRFGGDRDLSSLATEVPINPSDIYIGGLNLRNCTFRDLNIAFFKPWGNIGNNISTCSFYKCNYHICAMGVVAEHAGADTVSDCHFQLAQICSIYFDGKLINGTGNYIITGCVFEANPGITIYVTDLAIDSTFSGGFLFEHNWIEESYKNNGVPRILKGVSYLPTVLIVENSNVNFENSNTVSCVLKKANIFYNNCSDSITIPITVTKDNESSIIVSNLRFTEDANSNFFTRDFIYEKRYENNTISIKTKPRWIVSHNTANVLASESFAEKNSYSVIVAGGANVPKVSVKDGLLFDKCLELNEPNGNSFYLDNHISIALTPDKYILWTLDARVVSGTSFNINIANSGGNSFSNAVVVKSKLWASYLGITKCNTTKTTGLLITTTDNTVARISAFQCLSFDSLQEMIEYTESGIFSTKNNSRSSGSESTPISGSWLKGDLVYNTNPTSGGYVGWICTAAGTPGTWKGFGLIES